MVAVLIGGATMAGVAETVRVTGRAMGTTWAVVFAAAEMKAHEVEQRVATRLEELEAIFSTYREESELSRFNRQETTAWIAVSGELARVAEEARRISEATGGAFDPTVAEGRRGRGSAAWDVKVEGGAALRKRDAQVRLDFSSVAKGFAVDEMSALLSGLGVTEHVVQIGGDMRAGPARAWRVGVEAPGGEGTRIAAVVELPGGRALSTSGNYRQKHIIDPRTGGIVESELGAVSVVAESCARSSAWATGLFVLGTEEGLRVAETRRIAALFQVSEAGTTRGRRTTAWKD